MHVPLYTHLCSTYYCLSYLKLVPTVQVDDKQS